MPAVFSQFETEYNAATTQVAMFDTSDAGKLTLIGPDAAKFLHNLSTNDVKNLPKGGGCEAYLCDHRAKVQHAIWVYHVQLPEERQAIWVETTPGRAGELLSYLDRYLISEQVELSNASLEYCQFHITGPKALETVTAVTGHDVGNLTEFQHLEWVTKGIDWMVRRRDALGQTGFDIISPIENAGAIWKAFIAAGVTPAGSSTYETLRVEAGMPIYGIDIDASRFIMEVARAERAVSFTKGCFPGQEPIVMARDRAGFVNRAFLGLKVSGHELFTPGAKLFAADAEVGVITSLVQSPRLGSLLVVGYVKRGFQDPGKTLELRTDAGNYSAEVLGFPPLS